MTLRIACASGGRLARDEAEAARAVLAAGGVAVFPTETYYGLGGDPRQADAMAKVFRLKGRPDGRPLPLVATDLAAAVSAFDRPGPSQAADLERLATAFWPGPLTVVLPAAPGLAAGVCAADGTVGVRVSGLDVARQLAALCGGLLAATSANASGRPPATDARSAEAGLLEAADLVVDGGETPGGAASTIVALAGGSLRVLRFGAIPAEAVGRALGRAVRPGS